MRKTVSLAMTTYNGEKYLREQLDSIYNQTMVPDEVVVCDDNSKDGTVEILEEYHKAKGLKYYVNNPGLGVNKNFFKAISLCSCDYIALSDQDDVWLPVKIETLYIKMLEIDNGIPCAVSSQSDDMDSNGNIINKRKTKEDTEGYAASLLGSGIGQGCTMMFNRELALNVLSHLSKNQILNDIMYDALISHFAAIFGRKYNIMSSLMLYRHHADNVLAKSNKLEISKRQRINNYGTFVGFITDKRIEYLTKIYISCKDEIKNREIFSLLSKIYRMYGTNSFIKKIYLMITIKELTVKQKLIIAVKSVFVHSVKVTI